MTQLRFRAALNDIALRFVRPPGQLPIYLAANEAPYGPLPSVAEALAREIVHVNRYPDDGAIELKQAISDWLGVAFDNVVIGAGSLGVLHQLLTALCEPSSEVVYPWRSFDVYPRLIKVAGATPRAVPLRDERNDLGAMLAQINDNTRMVIVCNPNNPTGPGVGRQELSRFLDEVPPTCLILLDEAYHEYVRDPELPNGLDLYRNRVNVAVLRTFSKAYGLAALRVGYLIAQQPVAEVAEKVRVTYSVNRLAQVAAVASIAAQDELHTRVDETVRERTRMRNELLSQGWQVPPSEGNFVWLRLGPLSAPFATHVEQFGVALKSFPGEGVRITLGEPTDNDVILVAAAAFRSVERHGGKCC